MKWYGLNNSNFNKNKFIHLSIYKNFKIKNLSLNLKKHTNLNYCYYFFYLPHNWNCLIFKTIKKFMQHQLIYIYSNMYFFYLPYFISNNFYYDKQLNTIQIKFMFVNNFYKIYWHLFKQIFYSFNIFFFKKIKFKGKGYYIYKNLRNTIAMQFGYSHKIQLFFFFFNIKFLSKTSIFFFGLNFKQINFSSYVLKNIRPINIFTSKGIRFSKQIIYKKTGKISSYR
jgi:hypothetical protein